MDEDSRNRWPPGDGSGIGATGRSVTMPRISGLSGDLSSETVPDNVGRRVVRMISAVEGDDLNILLDQGVNRIGRQRSENHIVLASPEISRFHAELEISDQTITLRDLGSANGTRVNGKAVRDATVADGDLVEFGDNFSFRLQVEVDASPVPAMTIDAEPPVPDELETRPQRHRPPGLLAGRPQPFSSSGRPRRTTGRLVKPNRPAELDEPRPRKESGPSGGESKTSPTDTHDLSSVERERRQLAVLFQLAKRCLEAEKLADLDRLLVNVLERVVTFERGFLTYRLPSGDWKLVLAASGYKWDRHTVRALLHMAMKGKKTVLVEDSARDRALGVPEDRVTDVRLLLPLMAKGEPCGALFLVTPVPQNFAEEILNFLEMFCDIAALGLSICGRLERL